MENKSELQNMCKSIRTFKELNSTNGKDIALKFLNEELNLILSAYPKQVDNFLKKYENDLLPK